MSSDGARKASLYLQAIMFKLFAIIFCFCFSSGCMSEKKFTTKEEYIEERRWDGEKGLVTDRKSSWGIHWENK